MTELLLRLFIRNDNCADDAAIHASTGKLAGIVGIVCNALLFLGMTVILFRNRIFRKKAK